jgi:putative ABC transport system substrate-binding protein
MAVKILKDGEDISTMPIEYAPNFTKEYNKDICEELDITVPDDYVAIGEAAEDTEEASDDADAADEATAETAEDDATEEADE